MKLSEIIPYSGNAKKHDEKQIDNVVQSIKEFGFVQPIVVDENNVVVIGHCRLLALKKLGYEDIPDEWVKKVNIDADRANKLRLLDNKLNESDWDFDLLDIQVPEIDFSDYNVIWGLSGEVDWSDVDDLNEDTYDKPVKDCLECPNCHHVDTATRFKKVEGNE